MALVKTAEAVCIGHPDKLCDLVADTILDDVPFDDPAARMAVEVECPRFVESFHNRMRDELLEDNSIENLEQAQTHATQ